ncbi:GH17024 [Drosophila grimshawi]|uniref:GH17024 n=1 Tax=Drosophila grimshawi TaxID=7222 RepID=B4IZ15_DROGR|nr:GH17024 [Drosophila grimshawi]
MSRIIAGARGLFRRHPFVTNSAIYGSLYVGAEFTQQYVSKRWLPPPKEREDIDYATVGRYAVMGMSIMEGSEDIFLELREKFVPTFLRSCIFWLPAQALNFMFIAPRFRIIYMGLCGMIWVNILCWIKRQSLTADSTTATTTTGAAAAAASTMTQQGQQQQQHQQ